MKLVSTKDALRILKISRKTLFKWCEVGKITVMWQSAGPIKARVFDEQELEKLASRLPQQRAPGVSVYKDKDRRYKA